MPGAHHLIDMLEPATRATVERGVIATVKRSFAEDRQRTAGSLIISLPPTRSEIRRRTRIAYDWFATMRGDMGYSVVRCLDVLPEALRATLDGRSYEPAPADRSWAPSKGG